MANFRQFWTTAAWVVVALAIACALAELLAGPGYRLGLLDLGAAIQTIRWAASGAAVVFFVALFSIVLARRRRIKRAVVIFLAAAIVSFLTSAPPTLLWFRVQSLPHIHDISTDVENPPRYAAVLPLRKGASNATEYTATGAAQQRLGYPDIAPVVLEMSAPRAFERAERVARSMRWDIVAVEPGELRIEATATTFLFGFKDDIVIRVQPMGSGSRVDMRSLSRVGGSDFGVNAGRIRAFMHKLRADKAE
ncbi:MAG: DUF1499 domain-containing protein [Polaromonas sp.]